MSGLYSRARFLLAAFAVALFSQSGAALAQAKNEIVIGYSVSLTGKFSTEGSDTHRAYQLWAEEVNKQGGIQVKSLGKKLPVKLVHYDDTSDTNAALRNYERLMSRDNVDHVFSPWGSGINFAISALTEKNKYPIVLSSAASDPIFNRGFKYIFECTQLASNLYNGLVEYIAASKGEIKTVAIAYENFLFTQTLRTSLVPKLEKLGVKVVADEQYPLGGQDFTSLLTKIKAAKPDAFIAVNIMPSSVYLTRQMAEVGFKPKLYSVNIGPMYQQEFVEKLGAVAENIVENGFWHQDLPYQGAKQFYDTYVAKYKRPPSTDAAYGYISSQIMQQAIEQAGVLDREKVTGTLRSGKFSTILGPYEYDEKGISKSQLSFLAQIQNGKRVIVWPKDVANATVKLSAPQ
jgi:branched-chain amino acid transport system substrate-binding protein